MNLSRLRAVWTSPYFTAITGACTVLGFLLAIYFYRVSVRERQLVYSIPPTRTVIADPARVSALRVTYDGKPVRSRVSGLQVVIWNAGRESIRRTNVLESVRIVTVPRTSILEARILRASRRLTNPRVTIKEAPHGEITFDFDILEEADGAEIQLLYAGGGEVTAVVVGTIEGRRRIKHVPYAALRKTAGAWLYLLMIVGGPVAFALAVKDFLSSVHPHTRLGWAFVIVLLSLFALTLVYTGIDMLRNNIWPALRAPQPPFEF